MSKTAPSYDPESLENLEILAAQKNMEIKFLIISSQYMKKEKLFSLTKK